MERAGIGAACPVRHHDLMNGFLNPSGDPVLVVNTFVWDEAQQRRARKEVERAAGIEPA